MRLFKTFKSFQIIIVSIYSCVFIFASIDDYLATDYTLFFFNNFHNGLWNIHNFTLYEFSLFTFLVLITCEPKKTEINIPVPLRNIFFSASILVFIFKMVNPNNLTSNPILGMPLLSDVSNFSLLFLLYVSLFSNSQSYFKYIKLFFKLTAILLTFRMIILFIFWVFGEGAQQFGANSTLSESDTLFYIAFFNCIFFTLFLIRKKKLFLFLSIFYFVFLVLSYRRTALAVAIISIFLIYFFFLFINKKYIKVIVFAVIFAFLYSAINATTIYELTFFQNKYIARFISALPGMSIDTQSEFNDSGHWEQTTNTFRALASLGFWGKGYGKAEDIYLPGQTTAIHNVYAASWAYFGMYLTLFYFFIFMVSIIFLFHLILNHDKNNYPGIMIFISLSVFLCTYLVLLSSSPLIHLQHIKSAFFWVTVLTMVLRARQYIKVVNKLLID